VIFEERLVATNKTWEESFELLLEFRRQHGHTNVPKPVKGMPAGDDHSLRVWADRQRAFYHTCHLVKKQSVLTKKRVKKLHDIGFDWGTHKSTQKNGWNRRFNELQEYVRIYGDCNVPTSYEENKSLGRWVSDQRSHYNKLLRGKKSPLSMERRLALESIGFQWKKPKKSNGGAVVSNAKKKKKDTADVQSFSDETMNAAMFVDPNLADAARPSLDTNDTAVAPLDSNAALDSSMPIVPLSPTVGQTVSL